MPADSQSDLGFHVIDDEESHLQVRQWLQEQMLAGAGPDMLLQKLLHEGWDADTAQELVEKTRKESRLDRGVITREQVLESFTNNRRQRFLSRMVRLALCLFFILLVLLTYSLFHSPRSG